jgi:hypothetical protein
MPNENSDPHLMNQYIFLMGLVGLCDKIFILDNKPSSLNENDIQRRNTICKLLEDWGLVKIVASEREQVINNLAPLNQIKIIPYKEKSEWRLENKHTIGKSRNV